MMMQVRKKRPFLYLPTQIFFYLQNNAQTGVDHSNHRMVLMEDHDI